MVPLLIRCTPTYSFIPPPSPIRFTAFPIRFTHSLFVLPLPIRFTALLFVLPLPYSFYPFPHGKLLRILIAFPSRVGEEEQFQSLFSSSC